MANNFRLTGSVYVSKEGSDANSGLTPDLPKLTVQAGLSIITTGQILVVGSGVYKESLSKSVPTGTYNLIADGFVKLDGDFINSSLNFQSSATSTVVFNIDGFYFNNYKLVHANNNSQSLSHLNVNFSDCNFFQCSFTATTSGNSSGRFSFSKCVLVNCFGTPPSGTLVSLNTFDLSILINTVFGLSTLNIFLISQFTNSYIDWSSVIGVSSAISSTAFNFNNIQGSIIMNTGTYSGIALNFADHRTYYPTFNVQSMSADPKFNNVQNLNFTLQSTSPHIRAANDYISNIGGTEYAKHYLASSTEFTSGATITNLTLLASNAYTLTQNIVAGSFVVGYKYVIVTAGSTDFTLIGAADSNPGTIFTATGVGTGTGTANALTGNIITAPLAVQSYPATKPLTGIIWEGSLEFNKSVTAGTVGNQRVPAYDTYTTGAGASPDRLKIKMRYSTQSASPTAGQWTNGGYWATDTYQLVEVNMKPKVDSNGIGNGDYTYIEFVGLGDLVPTWIQLDIKLRNDYNP